MWQGTRGAALREEGRSPLRAALRARQPLGETLRGVFRGRSVERHHCGGHGRHSNQVCTPAIGADSRDFDVVRAAFDGFGDVLHEILGNDRLMREASVAIVGVVRHGSSESRHEDHAYIPGCARSVRQAVENSFRLTASPQDFHRTFTGFAQPIPSARQTRHCPTLCVGAVGRRAFCQANVNANRSQTVGTPGTSNRCRAHSAGEHDRQLALTRMAVPRRRERPRRQRVLDDCHPRPAMTEPGTLWTVPSCADGAARPPPGRTIRSVRPKLHRGIPDNGTVTLCDTSACPCHLWSGCRSATPEWQGVRS